MANRLSTLKKRGAGGWGVGVGGGPLLETSLLAILACLNAETFGGGNVPKKLKKIKKIQNVFLEGEVFH